MGINSGFKGLIIIIIIIIITVNKKSYIKCVANF